MDIKNRDGWGSLLALLRWAETLRGRVTAPWVSQYEGQGLDAEVMQLLSAYTTSLSLVRFRGFLVPTALI